MTLGKREGRKTPSPEGNSLERLGGSIFGSRAKNARGVCSKNQETAFIKIKNPEKRSYEKKVEWVPQTFEKGRQEEERGGAGVTEETQRGGDRKNRMSWLMFTGDGNIMGTLGGNPNKQNQIGKRFQDAIQKSSHKERLFRTESRSGEA